MNADKFILTLNAGSSSLKFAVFEAAGELRRLQSGEINRIGLSDGVLTIKTADSQTTSQAIQAPTHLSCVEPLLKVIGFPAKQSRLVAVGHRIVHGGEFYTEPALITLQMLDKLRKLSSFAPEHLPPEIELIEAFTKLLPNVPQVACFDTAFHRDLSETARLLPIPRRYKEAGVRRYGFHGLSYEFLMSELVRLGDASARKGRIVLAHLGNGASLSAVLDGRCIDTSMGFTPAAGLVMGRRTGDLDPGLVSYLMRTERMSAEHFDRLVNHESGLLGVSGISSDMEDLLAIEAANPQAAEAVELFCYSIRKWIGAFTAVLGGLDEIVFSGGIGQNSSPIRARICKDLAFLGLEIDAVQNAANAAVISTNSSGVTVRVIRTDEELAIVRSVSRLLALAGSEKETQQ